MARKISDDALMDINDTLADVWTDLEHLKERLYGPDNNPNVVDTYCNRINGIQQVVETLKALAVVHLQEY